MAFKMGKNVFVLFFTILLFFAGVYSVSAYPPPSKTVNGFLSNVFSALMKWGLSLKATAETALSRTSTVKFESGYNVETVFDGSKLGIEPYSVELLPDGDLLMLDSANSNLYRMSSLSLHSRPKLVSGSTNGYSGHVDGKLKEARMYHPKGLTTDHRGNIYIADTDNMAIRKISEEGVTTIAGCKRGRGGGHVDGPSEDAKFSSDFDVLYLGSSCSLLVIDRGNKAIREIQLNFNDCAYQYENHFSFGFAVLIVAGLSGYMLAMLQLRGRLFTPLLDKTNPYQTPVKSSIFPPLIPNEDEQERQEETLLGSFARLVVQTGESVIDILGTLFSIFNKRSYNVRYHCPKQESFVIPDEDEPPSVETPQKTYAFMSADTQRIQQLKKSRVFWEDDVMKK